MLPFVLAIQLLAVDLPQPLELAQEPVEVVLTQPDEEDRNRHLRELAADPAREVVLRLLDVRAESDPGVSWELHLSSSAPGPRDDEPALIGILSLFGAPPIGEFAFPLDAALLAVGPAGLEVRFTPISGLETDGQAVPAVVRSTVHIGGLRLEPAGPGSPEHR